MKNDTLTSFIKAQCANFTGKCLVIEKKKACKYFKKSVLPLAELQGIYSKILLEYTNIDKSIGKDIHIRFCECGTELKPRERFCGKCKKIRRLETKREYQQKYRGT